MPEKGGLMRSIIIRIAMGVILISMPGLLPAQEITNYQKTSSILENVVLENLNAYQNENISRAMETIHTLSPQYLLVKEAGATIFPTYDLKYELLSFKYLVSDGEYAIARGMQKTSKISGPAFRNNIIEIIFIFKQEDGKWKLWNQAVLALEFVN